MSDNPPPAADPSANHHNLYQWRPPCNPRESYPLENPQHPPPSTFGDAVRFPCDGNGDRLPCDFQDFVWDIVSAIARINSALFAYRKGIALGIPEKDARIAYDNARLNYNNIFLKWKLETEDKSTWIEASVSHTGYVTDVLVRSRAFSIYTPGQSESYNSTNPPQRVPP